MLIIHIKTLLQELLIKWALQTEILILMGLIYFMLLNVLDVLIIMFYQLSMIIVILIPYYKTVKAPLITMIAKFVKQTLPESESQVILILMSLLLNVSIWLFPIVQLLIVLILTILMFLFVPLVLKVITGTQIPTNVYYPILQIVLSTQVSINALNV